MERCDIAIRFCQTSFIENDKREDFLDTVRDRVADLKAEMKVKGTGQGKGEGMNEDL